MVDRHGRLWWSRAAVSHDQAMPQRRLGWLDVECNRCKTEANLPGRYPPAARHGDREAGNLAEISIMPERAPRPQQVEPVLGACPTTDAHPGRRIAGRGWPVGARAAPANGLT